MAFPQKWTAEDETTLRTLWHDGLSAKQIAARLGDRYSRSAIIAKANRLNLEARDSHLNRGWEHRTPAAKPPPKAAPKAQEPPSEEPPPLGAINEHADSGCRWIHGDVQTTFQFCAHSQTEHSAYCAFHAAKSKGQQPRPAQSGAFRSDRIR